MKNLQPYPKGGLGPLTAKERESIENLKVGDALEIAIALVREAGPALASLTAEDHDAARFVGFEDAAHDLLLFLASDWFDLIVDAATESKPGTTPPLDYVQVILDNALGKDVLQVVEIEPEYPIWWRVKPPRGYKYGPVLLKTLRPGDDAIGVYESRILAAIENPEVVVLELPGCTLAIEVNNGDSPLREV